MSNELHYQFADGNLLDQPNNYSYTTYHGDAFINAWRTQRNSLQSESTSIIAPLNSTAIGKTDLLLASIQQSLSSKTIHQHKDSDLLNLVKRFEVSKRLHANYTEAWKPVDINDYHSYQRYILFGEILEQAYATTHFLPLLNCLLKVIDTISSFTSQLSNDELLRVKRLVDKESLHVSGLSKRCEGLSSVT